MGRRTVPFNVAGIGRLPADKPVVYKIRSANGTNIYTGVAQRNRVRARLEEHLPGAKNPIAGGRSVEIEQTSSIDDARAKEARIISRSRPRHNIQGK